MVELDILKLRDDECGTAAYGGFSAVAADAWVIENVDGYELSE